MRKRTKICLFIAVGLAALAVPALAFAQTATEAVPWQETVGKAMAAALVMSASALGAGYAQSRIGAAGAGAIAERPEISTQVIVLQALTEFIVLLGFVIAFMINS